MKASEHPHYEQEDIRPLYIAALFGGILVLVIVVLLLMAGLVVLFNAYEEPPTIEETRLPQVDPRLQPNPRSEWDSYEATQQAYLNSYGWIDEEADMARIPIEEAIDRVVEEGLPDFRSEATPPPPATTEEADG